MSLSPVHRPRATAPALIAALAVAWFAALAPAALASSPPEPLSPAPSVSSGALAEGAFDGTEKRVSARLLVDVERAQPGQTIRVGVLFDLDPGWHIYWRSPGSSGLPTELHWQDSGDATIEIGDIEWPTPSTFDEAEGLIVTYGYTGRVLLHANAHVADDANGPIELGVEARFLVCEIACVPGEISLSRSLAVAATSETASKRVVALFDEAAASKPLALADYGLEAKILYSQSAVRPGDRFEAAISLGCQGRADCTSPESGEAALGYAFIPDLIEGMEVEVTQTRAHPLSPGDLLIELRGTAGAGALQGPQRMSGIASLRLPDGRSVAAEVDLPLPRASAGSEVTSIGTPWRTASDPSTGGAGNETAFISLWRAILFALLGGLILNLMPCVLPVLAIKVFAIAELAHSDRREVLASGAAYTAGIVGSMLVLAAAVIGIRAGGEAIGWGFQFQEPMFVAAICTVLVVFALNLFGVFEIFAPTGSLANVGTTGNHTRRSFFEGLLAVVLATPCSAPFLGPAVGFAFAGTPASVVAIFVAIGVGLASPFVAITLVPAWARFLPRSGAWMTTLRSALGFAVLAPIVWLLWVVGQQVGNDGVAALLGFLVAVSFATWMYGTLQARGSNGAARTVAIASLAAALFALAGLPLEPTEATALHREAAAAGGDPAYSRAALTSALEDGSAVFVYYTADWCITCKVNEKTTLADTDVRSAFEELGVTVLVADWTQRDAAIANELAHFGRAGVPLYLVYDARKPDAPVLLPEILTPGLVIDALTAATRS